MSGKSFMHGGGEPYSGVVPTKQSNKAKESRRRDVEGRPLANENTQEPNSCRTPIRVAKRATRAGACARSSEAR
jgi:hypothetical protein